MVTALLSGSARTAAWVRRLPVAAREPGRRHRCVPLEVAGEVRLIVEAGRRRRVRGPGAAEQLTAGDFDPAADDVSVRAHAELTGEAADEMGNGAIERRGRHLE